MDDMNKKTLAIVSVLNNLENLPFMDQLAVAGMVYELGEKMEKIAKKNKIDIREIDDNDFSKFPKMQWGIRFDNGKEQ